MEPVSPAQRLAAWLAGLNANTRRAYTYDLERFAAWLGEATIGSALDRLISVPRARALLLLEQWRDAEKARGVSSAAINRGLAAVNSALRQIAKADIGPGRLDVSPLKSE